MASDRLGDAAADGGRWRWCVGLPWARFSDFRVLHRGFEEHRRWSLMGWKMFHFGPRRHGVAVGTRLGKFFVARFGFGMLSKFRICFGCCGWRVVVETRRVVKVPIRVRE